MADSRFYQAWDPRALSQWIKYGLRDLPTALYPQRGDGENPPVTLTTTKAQEVFSYLRPKYYGQSGLAPEEDHNVYGDMHPDDVEKEYPFYRPEPSEIFRRLPEVKPPVLYIFGKTSELATLDLRRKKLETTGTGVGGSGGQKAGRVKEVVLDSGHLVPMENVTECAEAAASFANEEISRWQEMNEAWQQRWVQKSRLERISLDDQWKKMIGPKR